MSTANDESLSSSIPPDTQGNKEAQVVESEVVPIQEGLLSGGEVDVSKMFEGLTLSSKISPQQSTVNVVPNKGDDDGNDTENDLPQNEINISSSDSRNGERKNQADEESNAHDNSEGADDEDNDESRSKEGNSKETSKDETKNEESHHPNSSSASSDASASLSNIFEATSELIPPAINVIDSNRVPNADTALRVLRRFLSKTSDKMHTTCGGTRGTTILGMIFGTDTGIETDACCAAYRDLVLILSDDLDDGGTTTNEIRSNDEKDGIDSDDDDASHSSDSTTGLVIESIFGRGGDTAVKSRLAVAAFCALTETWAEASALDLVMIDDVSEDGPGGRGGVMLHPDRLRMLRTLPSGRKGSCRKFNEKTDKDQIDSNDENKFKVDPHLGRSASIDIDENGNNNGTDEATANVITNANDSIDGSSNGDLAIEWKKSIVTGLLLAAVFNCAQQLVAHGCLDGVVLVVNDESENVKNDYSVGSGENNNNTISRDEREDEERTVDTTRCIQNDAIDVIVDSVFLSNLSSKEAELSALQFLLTTGSRGVVQCESHKESDEAFDKERDGKNTESVPTSAVINVLVPKIGNEGTDEKQEEPNIENIGNEVVTDLERKGVQGDAAVFEMTKPIPTTLTKDPSSPIQSDTSPKIPQKRWQATLRGTQLLQALRLCYHVYLKTWCSSNRTTAKAVLRQIVSSVFVRLETFLKSSPCKPLRSSVSKVTEKTEELDQGQRQGGANRPSKQTASEPLAVADFPSPEHRDAFLVLRSLCKLSMKPLVAVGSDGILLWDGDGGGVKKAAGDAMSVAISAAALRNESPLANAVSTSTSASTPVEYLTTDSSMDSRVLALERIVEVLRRPGMGPLLLSCPQLVFAVRQYLCHSLLKNCTSDSPAVVNLSLRLFVPIVRDFRSVLKMEIEAFVTNVFFVILDSKNSTVEHKMRVVMLFEEICGDPDTLAEIFLNYDCDLSAVDLFQRIVGTLAKAAMAGLRDGDLSLLGGNVLVAGAGIARAERIRQEHRELRLEAMRAVRRVLQSLNASIVTTTSSDENVNDDSDYDKKEEKQQDDHIDEEDDENDEDGKNYENENDHTPKKINGQKRGSQEEAEANKEDDMNTDSTIIHSPSLVQIYDSKKKRREEEARAIFKFNQRPFAGIKYASDAGIIDGGDPSDVASYLLANKGVLDKTQIGECLGREAEYKEGFALKVLHQYCTQLDFSGLPFDDSIRFFLSGFRLPGEAQKIDRIMEKFAERYIIQNPDIFPTADAAFILAFSIIMLNTDLHNPAIKDERRMTKDGFVRMNRGICDGQDLPDELLFSIFDRIKDSPISLKEDDDARERTGETSTSGGKGKHVSNALIPATFFSNHYIEMDRTRESNFQKERDQIVRSTESMLRRKKKGKNSSTNNNGIAGSSGFEVLMGRFVKRGDPGLKDEYVTPMFDVTWGPALAVFSTAMESANGSMGSLLAIASDEEIELAAENAASAIDVCLSGFRLAICTASLCGNITARSAFVHALSNFSRLGTGRLLEHRHIRCVHLLLETARDDGELLGDSWEYIFKALSEVARLRQVFELTARVNRAETTTRRQITEDMKRNKADYDTANDELEEVYDEEDHESVDTSEADADSYFSETDNEFFEEEMDKMTIDKANAANIQESIPSDLIDAIYHCSVSFSAPTLKYFIFQLCRVSRMEISGYGGHIGSNANDIDLTSAHFRRQHSLLTSNGQDEGNSKQHNQPDIHSLQKLVEVTHYNMESRPRLVFANIWNIVSGHLTSTALHSNAAVAMYAIDSFRQLSIQLLKRTELGVFEFQRRFLKPFDTIMQKCQNSSVKEFLLKSVEQIILLFGVSDDINISNTLNKEKMDSQYNGSLRSGWRPIFAVIGHSAHDTDDNIARLGFKLLSSQLRQCLNLERGEPAHGEGIIDSEFYSITTNLRADRFIDLVETLLMFVSGAREEMSSLSIDHLVTLSKYLADENIPLPRNFKETSYETSVANGEASVVSQENRSISGRNCDGELELWWPILLGLSQSVGHQQPNIRIKSLVTLLAIINQHFFPLIENKSNNCVMSAGDGNVSSSTPQHGDLQTLQLIFRGILTPILEHAEININARVNSHLPLPEGFIRFISKGYQSSLEEKNDHTVNEWIDSTFDHLIDGSISLALKSIEVYKNDMLIEEVLAMFNNCLISDLGALSVRGLKRLNHFITDDLVLKAITEETWATVSHMLIGSLMVRGLPNKLENKKKDQDSTPNSLPKDNDLLNDFVTQEAILAERRYIGSNAAMIIGSLLSDKRYVASIGMRWYLFLLTGLGKAINEWDRAADIMLHFPPKKLCPGGMVNPPEYAENSLYGRKIMVRLLLNLLARDDIFSGSNTLTRSNEKLANGYRTATHAIQLLRDECEALINIYVVKEGAAIKGTTSPMQTLEIEHMNILVCNLLDGINKLDDSHFGALVTLAPILSSCIQINDKAVRISIHQVLQRVLRNSVFDEKVTHNGNPKVCPV